MEEHLEELLTGFALHEFCNGDYEEMLRIDGIDDSYYSAKEKLDEINSLNGESPWTIDQRQIIGM